MRALLLRGMLTCLATGWSLCFGWFVAAGVLLDHAPNPVVVDDREFVARPEELTYYHLPGCRYIDQTKPLLHLDGERMARKSGRVPCPHCLKSEPMLPTRIASESPQP